MAPPILHDIPSVSGTVFHGDYYAFRAKAAQALACKARGGQERRDSVRKCCRKES